MYVLSALHILIHLVLRRILGSMYYDYPHSSDEDT